MPMQQYSPTVTRPDPNTVQVAVSNETLDFSLAELRAFWNGLRSLSGERALLVFQIHLILQQAGVNPHTATPAQLKSTIEAGKIWWGN